MTSRAMSDPETVEKHGEDAVGDDHQDDTRYYGPRCRQSHRCCAYPSRETALATDARNEHSECRCFDDADHDVGNLCSAHQLGVELGEAHVETEHHERTSEKPDHVRDNRE